MAEPTEEPLPGPSPEALLALRVIPKFGDALAQYAIDRHQRRLERAGEVVTTAAETLKLDPAVMIERIIEDDRLADLLNDAIQAAARSGLEAKRRAFGKVLAQAIAGDDADVDEAIMLAASLTHLEAVHVRVMGRLARRWRHGPRSMGASRSDLSYVTGLDQDISETVVLQLQAWGLATSDIDVRQLLDRSGLDTRRRYDYEPRIALTSHGLRVIEFLVLPSDDEIQA